MYFQWTHFDSGSCLRGLPVLQLSAQFISWTNCCLSPAAWQTFKTLKRGLEEDMLRWAALSKNHFQGRRNVNRSNRNIIVPLKKENCLSLSPLGEHDFTRFFCGFEGLLPFISSLALRGLTLSRVLPYATMKIGAWLAPASWRSLGWKRPSYIIK